MLLANVLEDDILLVVTLVSMGGGTCLERLGSFGHFCNHGGHGAFLGRDGRVFGRGGCLEKKVCVGVCVCTCAFCENRSIVSKKTVVT